MKLLNCLCYLILATSSYAIESQVPSDFERQSFITLKAEVVRIEAILDNGVQSVGSGFLYGTPEFHIVTAYHVIRGARSIVVFVGSKALTGTDIFVWKIADDYDLVDLRLTGRPSIPHDLQVLPINTSDPRQMDLSGRSIYTAGFPRGWWQMMSFKSDSVVDQPVHSTDLPSLSIVPRSQYSSFKTDLYVIPINTAIYNGMSGAPILIDGEVAGVISGSLSEGDGIGWAIPIHYLESSTVQDRPLKDMQGRWPENRLLSEEVYRHLVSGNIIGPDYSSEFQVGFDRWLFDTDASGQDTQFGGAQVLYSGVIDFYNIPASFQFLCGMELSTGNSSYTTFPTISVSHRGDLSSDIMVGAIANFYPLGRQFLTPYVGLGAVIPIVEYDYYAASGTGSFSGPSCSPELQLGTIIGRVVDLSAFVDYADRIDYTTSFNPFGVSGVTREASYNFRVGVRLGYRFQ